MLRHSASGHCILMLHLHVVDCCQNSCSFIAWLRMLQYSVHYRHWKPMFTVGLFSSVWGLGWGRDALVINNHYMPRLMTNHCEWGNSAQIHLRLMVTQLAHNLSEVTPAMLDATGKNQGSLSFLPQCGHSWSWNELFSKLTCRGVPGSCTKPFNWMWLVHTTSTFWQTLNSQPPFPQVNFPALSRYSHPSLTIPKKRYNYTWDAIKAHFL